MDTYAQPADGQNRSPIRDEIEINLVYVVTRILHGYKTIVACVLMGLLLSVTVAMLLPKTYTAEAVFLPPITAESVQSGSLFSHQDPSDLYLGMLGSRSVATSVIDQVHLKDVFHVKQYNQARTRLNNSTKFSVNKNTLISIAVSTTDPKLSAEIANAYLDALYKLDGSMSASASGYRREFFEEQLAMERDQLSKAEADMQAVQEKTGLILPESEAAAGLSATARLEAALQDAQTRLSTLLLSSTDQNPQVQQLRAQIGALEGQIRKQQTSPNSSPGIGIPSGARLPGLMLDYLRTSRELKERETLYDSLMQQYQKARLASIDPGPQLQVVDPAILPEGKSGPPRTIIVIIGTFLFGLMGLLWVLLSESLFKALRGLRTIASGHQSR
jgi:uncharacterized protein involved in exopolysaccharide biosynthesis